MEWKRKEGSARRHAKKVFKAKDQAMQGSPPLKDGNNSHTRGPKRSPTHHSIGGQKKGSP
jgi:hypothetical protein